MTTIPAIHINGTSHKELCREIRSAVDALYTARIELSKMTVHSRDHYIKSDKDSYRKARAEHEARFKALDDIIDELTEIHNGIRNQV